MGLNVSGEQDQELHAPQPLTSEHELEGFNSGVAELDDWLRRRAHKNQGSGASRTYVVTNGQKVIAYYCLAAGAVSNASAPSRVRRNMPDPIPVIVIGRLAVAHSWQGKGFGRALVRDAVLRTLQASEIAGIRAILVHAISEQARQFYESCGFSPSPIDPMTLLVTVADANAVFGLSNL